MTRVKICGLNDHEGFDAAVDAGADYVAFNFFAKSPRFVSPDQAAKISSRHAGGPLRVALLVQPDDALLRDVVSGLGPDILQLYDSPERVAEIQARTGIPVWRAVGVSTAADLPASTDGAAALLIEAKPPKDATRPGGNATAFDWGVLRGWKPDFDWMLAGGLTPENVAAAIRITGAPAVDVSSGVESSPGVKDPDRIRAFIRAARGG
jgi:phosphoribosylanthranilate isomerase